MASILIQVTTLILTLVFVGAVDPVSPLQFIGVGYDLLRGNIDGGTASKGSLDPGMLLTRQILEISPESDGTVPEVVYQHHSTCSPVSRQTLIYNGKSYQDQLLKSVVPSDTTPTGLLNSAFSLSTEFKDVAQATEGERSTPVVYHDIVTECSLATARYNEDLVQADHFNLTRAFVAAVCTLPSEYDATQFWKFFDHWGTHVVTKVELGTRTLQRNQTDRAGVFEHVRKYDSNLISGSSEYSYVSSFMIMDADGYPTSSASHNPLGTQHYTYSVGTVSQPEPIGLQVVPIFEMLDDKFWMNMNTGTHEDVCGNKQPRDVTSWRSMMLSALGEYALYKGASEITGSKLQIPVSWPTGSYGFMKAASGCPGTGVVWLSGWRKQDTEDTPSSNTFSSNINTFLAGQFSDNNLRTEFCIKADKYVTPYDLSWAPGTYCLLKYQACPAGFNEGYVFWDDEDSFNSNDRGGTLPDGTYDKNTKIYFCCRDDGPASTQLILPTNKPFVLVKYKGHCQVVRDMHVQEIFIHYDDEDTSNSDSSGGAHPLDDGGSINHALHFCYYSASAGPSGPGIIG